MIRMTFKNAEKNSHIYSGGRQVGGCMRLEETVCVAPYKKKYKDQIRLEEPVAWCFAQERRERDTYKMNILAPVKKADEIEYLVACGATELYCGYIPQI